jgi:hypothetical protein
MPTADWGTEVSLRARLGANSDLYAVACAVKAAVESAASVNKGLDLGMVIAFVAAAAFHQAHWAYWVRARG